MKKFMSNPAGELLGCRNTGPVFRPSDLRPLKVYVCIISSNYDIIMQN